MDKEVDLRPGNFISYYDDIDEIEKVVARIAFSI